ncbi:E3 ubiquitin-protein ligase TRIM71-like [Sycon ciliatum]|uniref:E3 ubiquitin-protein ligase TRIM71-like n=1 Tax=Sycon ciliatum TaxID=27933 RepID=UPI0031F6E38D
MSSVVQCGGCGSSTTTLKFVSCLHALCVPCLQNSLGFDGCIKCSQCLSATQLPVGTQPLRSLPNVVQEKDVIGATGQLQRSPVSPTCDECWDDTAATVVCEICDVKFCEYHGTGHLRSKSGRGHTINPLSAASITETGSTSSGSSSGRVVQHRCALHTNEVLKQFCLDCNQLLCSQCIHTGAHRHDEHKVIDIASAAQNTRDTLSTKLSCCTSECDGVVSSAIETVEKSIRMVHSQTEYASEKVSVFFKPLIEAVKKREDCLLAELDQLRIKKLELLEKQLHQLQECVSKGESAASILQSFEDDVELLRVWSWVDASIVKTMKTAEDEKEPCVTSGIVFGTTDTTSLLNDISKTGAVADVADGTLKSPDNALLNDHLNISIELPDSAVPSIVEQEQLENIGLEISISGLDEDTTTMCTQLTPATGKIQARNTPLQTGHYNISAKIGCVHLKGSPQRLVVSATPRFDGNRCGSRLIITNDGRSLSNTSAGGGWSSACTTPMATDTGSSTLKVRIDKTASGHIFLSACSSSNPNLEHYQQDNTQCFGWYGYKAKAHHTGRALGQRWQTGDVIHLTVDHDRHTLTGRHERTGATETIPNVPGNLYWIVALYDMGDKITLI